MDNPASIPYIIELGVCGIVVTLCPQVDDDGSVRMGGTIESDLAEPMAVNLEPRHEEAEYSDGWYDGAVYGLEALILACACAGVAVKSPEFLEAVETAVDAISNQE